MKKSLLIVGILLLYGAANAQQDASKKIPVSGTDKSIESGKAEPDTLAGETIEHCDAVIQAIDGKVAYVRNNAEENARAESIGWYEQMDKSRAYYVARRAAVVKRNQQN